MQQNNGIIVEGPKEPVEAARHIQKIKKLRKAGYSKSQVAGFIVPLGTSICDFIGKNKEMLSETEGFIERLQAAWGQVGPYWNNLVNFETIKEMFSNFGPNVLPITVLASLGFAIVNLGLKAKKKHKINKETDEILLEIQEACGEQARCLR